jgi:hypothetical protein
MLAFATLVAAAAPAGALPATTPAETLGTNGIVRSFAQVGNVLWVGGKFTQLVNRQGQVVRSGLNGLAALDAATGAIAAGVTVPNLTGSNAIVWDLSTDGSQVYAAGTFGHAGGSKNLLELDGLTGQVGQVFKAPALKTVLVDGNAVLGGGAKMDAWTRDGAKLAGFVSTTTQVDPTIRAHNTPNMYSDIAPMPGGGWLAACKCDWVLNPGEQANDATIEKAIVRLLPTGAVQHGWNQEIKADGAAFGWRLMVDADGVVLAAGGSDYTQKLSFDGEQIWKTDTNGSSQTVIRLGDRYVVGGHFRCVANNVFHPRLVALTLSGARDPSWVIPVTPAYNGVWALHALGNSLWVGGEFTKVGGTWNPPTQSCSGTKPKATGQVTQQYLALFP